MAGRINNTPQNVAFWPWPRNVREKLVERAQLDRLKKKGKKGDARNPPLASAALLEFMGPGHSSEELRLPAPVSPHAGEALTQMQGDLPALHGLMEKAGGERGDALGRVLSRLEVPADRLERLKGLLSREAGMLQVMDRLRGDLDEIHRRMKDEQKGTGY